MGIKVIKTTNASFSLGGGLVLFGGSTGLNGFFYRHFSPDFSFHPNHTIISL